MVPSQASWSKMDSSRPPNKWARPHSPPILDRYRYEEIFYLKNAGLMYAYLWHFSIYLSPLKIKGNLKNQGLAFEGFYEGSHEGYQWVHCSVDWRHFSIEMVRNREVFSVTNRNRFSCRQKQQWSHYFFISAPNANDSTDDVDYDFQPSLFQTPRRAVLEVAWEGTHSKDVMWSSHFLSDWVELHHHHHSHSHHWRDQCHLL